METCSPNTLPGQSGCGEELQSRLPLHELSRRRRRVKESHQIADVSWASATVSSIPAHEIMRGELIERFPRPQERGREFSP